MRFSAGLVVVGLAIAAAGCRNLDSYGTWQEAFKSRMVKYSTAGDDGKVDEASLKAQEEVKKKEEEGLRKFHGLNFGIGPTMKLGGKREILKASLVDNGSGTSIVRVSEDREQDVGVLLESHCFFMPFQNPDTADPEDVPSKRFLWGTGPFVALDVGDDDVLNGLGGGWMIGVRTGDTSSINVGWGVLLDRNVQVFGRGVHEDRPLPSGETQIRFRTISDWKQIVTFSFTWNF